MKDMIKRLREREEGFTIAELLIVVAIVAVLVAIAIPVFTGQLDKAKESTDIANARSLYGQLQSEWLSNDGKVVSPDIDGQTLTYGDGTTYTFQKGTINVGNTDSGVRVGYSTDGGNTYVEIWGANTADANVVDFGKKISEMTTQTPVVPWDKAS